MLLKPVLYTNHGEMPPNYLAAAVRAAYGPLTPQLEVCVRCGNPGQLFRVILFGLQAILKSDPLTELSDEVKLVLWTNRYLLAHYPSAITKFLHSVKWNSREAVYQAYHLLHVWKPPTPVEALQVCDV